jgi:hypothetical protein
MHGADIGAERFAIRFERRFPGTVILGRAVVFFTDHSAADPLTTQPSHGDA